MVTAIGIDIVETARAERLLRMYGDKFVTRILGNQERELLQTRKDRAQFIAGRFACKEAVIKALGKYLADRPAYNQIEIVGDEHGRPQPAFNRNVTEVIGRVRVLVSISHEKTHAVAMAVISEDV